ncbi:Integrase, catalytic core [Corchorus capsularis]|uniref:Integrase, catalytic core n=1 Tax=Corchorus capsularis TaxID=210143 RepID=A0A1R3JW53_COCAP|nr:Integrase, catalytic core [Corchorus capsularis]
MDPLSFSMIQSYNLKLLKLERKYGKTKKNSEEESNVTVVVSDEEAVSLICGHGDCNHVADPSIEWIVDTGATYHCVPKRELSTTYKAGDFGETRMGNKSVSQIVGIGDIVVQTSTGCTLTLKNVRHIPDLRMNLLSINVLDKEKYESRQKDRQWNHFYGSLLVAKGSLCCTMYKTWLKHCGNNVNAVEDDASANLWHNRLAHFSEKGLLLLARQSLIPIPSAKGKGLIVNSCDHCLFGKYRRVSFRIPATRKENRLELIHSDVCGPMEVESLGGNRYFLTFIDDASLKTWAFCVRYKSQVLLIFQKFHAMVERETGLPLKCIRTGKGGEYTSNDFATYCSKHEIRHELTEPGTPQHNGVAERMNRTIVERVRYMFKMAKLPKALTYQKVWSGKDPSYDHLKVFGCKAFLHVPKEQRSKLDSKATPCIFVRSLVTGLGIQQKKKIIRSRDVVFHKHETIIAFEKKKKISRVVHDDDLTPTTVPPTRATVGGDEQGTELGTDEPVTGNDELDGDDDIAQPDVVGIEQGEQPPLLENNEPQLRRSTRGHIPSTKYPSSEYLLLTNDGEPESFHDV